MTENFKEEHNEFDEITLTLDDGSELVCSVLGVFDVSEKEYVALLPVGEEEVYLYGFKEDGEDVELINIEDDTEFEAVSTAFNDLFLDEDGEYEYVEEPDAE